MASSDYFKGVNLRAVKEQIIFSIVVDFESLLHSNFTDNMKLIIRSMNKNGIYNFLSMVPLWRRKEFWHTEKALETARFGTFLVS
ncbi:hypothetical protein OROMI_024499 [Orobanche minor]